MLDLNAQAMTSNDFNIIAFSVAKIQLKLQKKQ
jgi:hypothetical protein